MPIAVSREPHAGVPVGVDDRQAAAGPENARGFHQRALDVGDVEVDLDRDHEVEGGVGNVESGGVALLDLHAVRQALPRPMRTRAASSISGLSSRPMTARRDPHLAAELAGEERRPAPHVETALAGPGAKRGARAARAGPRSRATRRRSRAAPPRARRTSRPSHTSRKDAGGSPAPWEPRVEPESRPARRPRRLRASSYIGEAPAGSRAPASGDRPHGLFHAGKLATMAPRGGLAPDTGGP